MELCEVDWLPEPDVVMARCRAAAAADALLSQDPDLRAYWANKAWKPGVAVARRHDGGGSYTYVVQSGDTMVIKVAVLRLSMSPDALARFQHSPDVEMPPLAITVLNQPEFQHQELSFLAWTQSGKPWQALKFRVDGLSSVDMGRPHLDLICQGAKVYYVFAQTYHEVTVDPPSLMQMFKLVPMDQTLALKISPDADFKKAVPELQTIGYPLA